MTTEEMDALPEGTRVRITWSGGNGPHTYAVYKHYGYVEPTYFGLTCDRVIVGWPHEVRSIELCIDQSESAVCKVRR